MLSYLVDFLCHILVYISVKDIRNDKEAGEAIRKYIAYKFEEHHRVNPEQLCVVLMDLSGSGTGNVVQLLHGSLQCGT